GMLMPSALAVFRLTITSNLPNDEHSIPRLEDHVERRFRGATDLSKAACSDYLGKFHLSGLRAQRHAHLLRYGHRHASHSRERIGNASDRPKVVFGRVARERLHQHPGPVGLKRAMDVSCGSDGIAKIV